MVDSNSLKKLKEDPKTSTWFKDRVKCVQGAYGRGQRDSEGNQERFNRTVYCSCIQGDSFKSFSKLNVSNISSAFSLFDSRLFPSSEDCL